MTRERSIYLFSTGLVCGVMAFSAVNFNLANPLGPMKGAFVHLGYPSYFRIELTIAKTLGVLAVLIPRIPFKVKEFAYCESSGLGMAFSSGNNLRVHELVHVTVNANGEITAETDNITVDCG
jgi:hypothetical protein